MTLLEVVVVVVVSIVLLAIIFPPLTSRKIKATKINCASNIKQVTLACRLWEGDSNDKYPMAISVANGGTMEWAATGNVAQAFLVMSNYLTTPRILYCPADATHFSATNFSSSFGSQNISYFIGLDANETNAQTFLSGDANFQIGGVPVKSGLLNVFSNTPIAWSAARHNCSGNIGLADGSVQSTTQSSLSNQLQQTGLTTNRFAIP